MAVSRDRVRQAMRIEEQAWALLSGCDRGVQGAVLASLLARWLRQIEGIDAGDLLAARGEMLAECCAGARRMVGDR